MKRIFLAKVNFHLALAAIAAVAVIASGFLAVRSVNAFSNHGGIIGYAQPCVLDNVLDGRCEECPNCSNFLGAACAGYTEIDWTPSGGTPGLPVICVPKGYPYYGGGYPRIGGFLFGNTLAPQVPHMVGAGP